MERGPKYTVTFLKKFQNNGYCINLFSAQTEANTYTQKQPDVCRSREKVPEGGAASQQPLVSAEKD